ncbi:Uncharacterised protein [Escherichia coli]|uniref:Uncharacterized protein n=1 Tax=Escherichia coli TaxID=562 RepID=A0A377BHW1_ECOLX|nr:Uncharacterised protein [Escherichia coli]
MVLIQPEYFYSQECHLMDRGYQVLACDSILENRFTSERSAIG